MNDEDLKKIIDGIKERYFLLKKNQWMYFFGGFFAFFIAIGVIGYERASKVASDAATDAAENMTKNLFNEEIEKYINQAREYKDQAQEYKDQAQKSLGAIQTIEKQANGIISDLNKKNRFAEIDQKLSKINNDLSKINNDLKKLQDSSIKIYSKSVVFGKKPDGQMVNRTVDKGHVDYKVTPRGAKRVVGAWWSLQHDVSNPTALKQFSIGGTSGTDNDTVTINGSSAIFRVRKADSSPGLIRVLFYVLYI